MELGVREWIIIIGALVVTAVLLDGFRSYRNDRRENLRLSRNAGKDDDLGNPELPSSVRVVARSAARPSNESGLDLDRDVPVLMDAVDEDLPPEAPQPKAPQTNAPQTTAPQTKAPQAKTARRDGEPQMDAAAEELGAEVGFERGYPTDADAGYDADYDDPLFAPKPSATKPLTQPQREPLVARRDDDDALAVQKPLTASRGDERKAPRGSSGKTAGKDDEHRELLVLSVMAREGSGIGGQELLQILLACDVRFGKMNIFHRYENSGGSGAEQFSVINLLEPGTFDLDNIAEFSTPGVSFFMHLPGPERPMEAFECMVETAKCLAKNLGCELRDEAQSVATAQTLEHYRQRIRDFERRQLTLV